MLGMCCGLFWFVFCLFVFYSMMVSSSVRLFLIACIWFIFSFSKFLTMVVRLVESL